MGISDLWSSNGKIMNAIWGGEGRGHAVQWIVGGGLSDCFS